MPKPDLQQVKQRFGIIGNNPLLNRAIETAIQVAAVEMSALITGESGVGKEYFPQIIHQFSPRKHGPYIAVNCGSIPEGTINSELFGHEKGSFTGAIGGRKGYFETAKGGTVFLDEVGELPLPTQAQLLRVLESGEFMKVGSSAVEKTDVRIVAATNLDMIEAVKSGKFREDLYFRLNSVHIRIPPLRNRQEDIPLLFRKFAADFAEKNRMPAITLTDEARIELQKYHWPGNIRQLKNITEQISVLEQEREITAEILKRYLPAEEVGLVPYTGGSSHDRQFFNNEREILYQVLFDLRKDVTDLKKVVQDLLAGTVPAEKIPPLTDTIYHSPSPVETEVYKIDDAVPAPITIPVEERQPVIEDSDYEERHLSLEEVEKEMIRKALERHAGKRKAAAEELKISERTLYRKINEFNLQ